MVAACGGWADWVINPQDSDDLAIQDTVKVYMAEIRTEVDGP